MTIIKLSMLMRFTKELMYCIVLIPLSPYKTTPPRQPPRRMYPNPGTPLLAGTPQKQL